MMGGKTMDIAGEIISNIPKKFEPPFIIAIDGRCSAGKTTLASQLQERLECTVFHMDDFFLRPFQRTAERYGKAGENVDHERFLSEILLPLKNGEKTITFSPFDCKKPELSPPVSVNITPIVIVEGSYSLNPSLWEYYDLRVFLTTTPKKQQERILVRNGSQNAETFHDRWIPLEEKYFIELNIKDRCDIVFET